MGQIITSQLLGTKPFINRPSFVDGDPGFAPLPIISTTCRVYPDNFAIHPSSKPFWGGSGFGGWTANHCHLMSFWNYVRIYEMVWHPQYSESVWRNGRFCMKDSPILKVSYLVLFCHSSSPVEAVSWAYRSRTDHPSRLQTRSMSTLK